MNMSSDIVRAVLTATVYDVAIKTPLEKAEALSQKLHHSVYLKREDLQPVHSFKLRGAYNMISQLSPDEKARGVIAASAGNHAQGVALAAKKLGLRALIVMPLTTPSIKVEAVKSYGATIELYGDNYSEAAEYCKQRVHETNRVYIHPFDDPLVIAGQGTIGKEIIEQLPHVTHIFVPVGGGGLIAGIGEYIKAIRPEVKIIGVEPVDSAALTKSLQKNERLMLDHVGIFADGVAVKQIGERTFEAAKKCVDSCITVTTDQICAATKDIFEATRSIVEPAGALAIAGIKAADLPSDACAVAVCSGANMTFERLQQVAERTTIGSGNAVLLAVKMPERAGALKDFCTNVLNGENINEFSYRLQSRDNAQVLVGLTMSQPKNREKLFAAITKNGFEYQDLSQEEISKEHVRYMVGGQSDCAQPELLYHIDFPERPGALHEFLEKLGDIWNISLFHYRTTASDTSKVLIGFEADDIRQLEKHLTQAGYEFKAITRSKGIKTFLQAQCS